MAEAAPKAQADWNLSVYANAPAVPTAAASTNLQNRERYERTARLFAVVFPTRVGCFLVAILTEKFFLSLPHTRGVFLPVCLR